MNQKHVTLAACLLAFGLALQAQEGGDFSRHAEENSE